MRKEIILNHLWKIIPLAFLIIMTVPSIHNWFMNICDPNLDCAVRKVAQFYNSKDLQYFYEDYSSTSFRNKFTFIQRGDIDFDKIVRIILNEAKDCKISKPDLILNHQTRDLGDADSLYTTDRTLYFVKLKNISRIENGKTYKNGEFQANAEKNPICAEKDLLQWIKEYKNNLFRKWQIFLSVPLLILIMIPHPIILLKKIINFFVSQKAFKTVWIIIIMGSVILMSSCSNADIYNVGLTSLSNEIARGSTSFEDKVLQIRKYVHERMKQPITDCVLSNTSVEVLEKFYKKNGLSRKKGNIFTSTDYVNFRDKFRYQMSSLEKIKFGYGWCDDLARVFIDLIGKQRLVSKYVELSNKQQTDSPHTIAEVLSPSGRWVIVDLDPSYDLVMYNSKGELASREDLINDFDILKKNKTAMELARKSPESWGNDDYLSMYINRPLKEELYHDK